MAVTAWSSEETIEKTYAHLGLVIEVPFKNAPFPHPARPPGYKFKGQKDNQNHYSDSRVLIFIPKGFIGTDPIDCVIHLHGHNNHVDKAVHDFKLIEQFARSGKNAILIVPQGPYDAVDSFGGKLENRNGFKCLMNEVLATVQAKTDLKTPTLGKIILSGHSGAYEAMAAILQNGGMTKQIEEVWLFDALYPEKEKDAFAVFRDWAKTAHHRYIDIYTNEGGTKSNSEALLKQLQRIDPTLEPLSDEDVKTKLTPAHNAFIHSKFHHSEVQYKDGQFESFLKSSILKDR